jgi:hypothetical protein
MVVLLVEDGGAVVGPDSKSAPRGEISSYARGLAVYSRRNSRPDLKYGAEEADSTKRHGGCDCGTRDDRRTPWMRAPSKAAWLDRVRCKSRLPRGEAPLPPTHDAWRFEVLTGISSFTPTILDMIYAQLDIARWTTRRIIEKYPDSPPESARYHAP